MRLLHITHQYRPAIGGSEKYITDLSEELVQRGHQVDVFTSRSKDYMTWANVLPQTECIAGVNIYRFNSLLRTKRAWKLLAYGMENYFRTQAWYYEPLIFYGSGPICPGMFTKIWRQARDYDLIHINNLHYSQAYLSYLAAQRHSVPLVITPHVHAEQAETHDIGYLHKVLREAKAIFAVTEAEKDYLLKRAWNNNIVVGGNGLCLDKFPPLDQRASRIKFDLPEKAFVVLFLGRKTEYKRLDLCLKAFVALRQACPNSYFLAVGPETDFSRQLWSQYQGLEGLIVRGAVSDEERLAALAACDVMALPSVGEAFGIVYLEAWAYNKPVIGAKIAAVSSLIKHGEDGFLIEPDQVDDLYQVLNLLATTPELATQMGRQGRVKLERRYTNERITDIVEGTYARLIRHWHTL